ncbi:hypothetical protein GQ44DRAFT_822207 [Phaeosphaeriaceae sp. PMI808]|nr:hypothetical protein GQ44DRAFT_822207 [Phaeosphaeriaceae sp. PMI808]
MGIKTLLRSDVYRRYRSFTSLPLGSVEFEKDKEDNINLYQGELFCRAKYGDGLLCGRKFSDRGALVTHIRRHHKQYSLAPTKTGRSTIKREQASICYFQKIIVIHTGMMESWTTPLDEGDINEHVPDASSNPHELAVATTATRADSNSTPEHQGTEMGMQPDANTLETHSSTNVTPQTGCVTNAFGGTTYGYDFNRTKEANYPVMQIFS